MSKLRVGSLFSGIGAFEKALTNLGIDFELTFFSEIDKYAIQSYCSIHNVDEKLNLGDVSKLDVEDIPDFDLMTYGYPCTDISVAGKQKGFSKESETRSSLLWEAMKIVKYKKPKYLIAENVKNLIGKKFKDDFDMWLEELGSYGYNTYYSVLNSKDFNVPQNRERVFVVSIRKDVDDGKFTFPIGQDSGIRLRDILEPNVDEKYYLSEEIQKRFKFNEKYNDNLVGSTKPEFRTIGQSDLVYKADGIMGTLLARDYKQPKQIMEVGMLDIKGHEQIRRVYSSEGQSPTLTTMTGGNRQPKIITYEIAQNVKVRKYEVDIEKLKVVLKNHKQNSNLTINDISENLKIPKTKVEHWFRTDDSFAIPTEDIWFKLKEILNIQVNDFDKSITEYIIKENEYEKSNRVYDEEGIAPTLTRTSADEKVLIRNELEFVGGIGEKDCLGDGKGLSRNYPQGNRVYDSGGVACSQTAQGGGIGSNTGLYLINGVIRGRYNEEGSIEQQLEIQESNLANTLTTVQKDNIVVEKVLIKNATKQGYLEATDGDGIDLNYPDSETRRGRVQPQRSHTITTSDNLGVLEGFKIRKLTPLECWRLMGFTDDDFNKAKITLNTKFHKGKDRSDSQLYKQAGNSIVVNVAEALLGSLFSHNN